jgi:hypothetical protein
MEIGTLDIRAERITAAICAKASQAEPSCCERRASTKIHLALGFPFLKPLYGDQKRDSQQVQNGVKAQVSGCVQ